jgi:hypothetical protein
MSLFYATTPEALILSLNEETLLAAMERHEHRRSGAEPAQAATWPGPASGSRSTDPGPCASWRCSKRRMALASTLRRVLVPQPAHPHGMARALADRDPVEVHESLFRERLECPGGGSYVWDETWQTMKSTVFGHPVRPKPARSGRRKWNDLARASFALTLRGTTDFERRSRSSDSKTEKELSFPSLRALERPHGPGVGSTGCIADRSTRCGRSEKGLDERVTGQPGSDRGPTRSNGDGPRIRTALEGPAGRARTAR